MLVFHSHCQMGNQMFIYACARSLAKKRNLAYCLSELNHLKYFCLAEEDRFNQLKYAAFKIINKIPGLSYSFQHMQDNRNDYTSLMLDSKQKRIWYYGYFQGEPYMFQNFNDIQKCFTIKQQYIDEYNIFRQKNFGTKRIIIVHIRLKDYKTFGPDFLNGPDLTLPFAYYEANIQKLIAEQADDNYQLVIMSDDIKEVKNEFKSHDAYFSEQSMIIDFQLLQNAHGAVISPSSFAWWACWLNEVKDAKIIVPEYFLGFKVKKEFPVQMIPKKFIKSTVL